MERDTENNHYYDHARKHDFNLGRFVSPDVLGGKPRSPQSWNRYTYARSNPQRYVDPNGRTPLDAAKVVNQSGVGQVAARANEAWTAFRNAFGNAVGVFARFSLPPMVERMIGTKSEGRGGVYTDLKRNTVDLKGEAEVGTKKYGFSIQTTLRTTGNGEYFPNGYIPEVTVAGRLGRGSLDSSGVLTRTDDLRPNVSIESEVDLPAAASALNDVMKAMIDAIGSLTLGSRNSFDYVDN
jgi:RHS repeat-associated protein